MNAGQLLSVAGDVVKLAEAQGVLVADGSFHFASAESGVAFAVGVEGILKAHGVVIPDKVDKVIKLIPLLLDLLS